MPLFTDTLGLTDSAFLLLRDLIHERTGVYYDDSRREMLTDRLATRVVERGFSHFLDYYYLLKYDAGADEEWQQVADALAVPQTYFWREIDQVQALVDIIVPQFAAADRPGPLRIWSAACSTGEEPLTIAMALDQAGWLDRLRIEIVGTDISPAAISRARLGTYRDRSLQALPIGLRERYFTPVEGGWRISPALHSRVQWATANLMVEAEIAPYVSAPVVFCRNVFIYFSNAAIRQAANMLARWMPSGGYLFVGAAESLLRATSEFELREVGEAFCYVRL